MGSNPKNLILGPSQTLEIVFVYILHVNLQDVRALRMITGVQRSADVLLQLRQRTQACISPKLVDADMLAIALCASSVDAEALLEFCCERDVRSEALSHMKELALSDSDFCDLFACTDPAAASSAPLVPLDRKRVVAHERTEEHAAARRSLEGTLQMTLKETAQQGAWQKGSVMRIAAHVALHRSSDASACLSAVVGGMVAADARRVENLKAVEEEKGIDVLSFSSAIMALAGSVCQ